MSVESHTGLTAFVSGLGNRCGFEVIGLADARVGVVRVNTLGGGLARAAH